MFSLNAKRTKVVFDKQGVFMVLVIADRRSKWTSWRVRIFFGWSPRDILAPIVTLLKTSIDTENTRERFVFDKLTMQFIFFSGRKVLKLILEYLLN